MTNSEVPDKNYLYGRYQEQERRRGRLGIKAAHKALDIPEDDVHIETRHGITWKEILAGAVAAGALGWGATRFLPDRPQEPTPTTPASIQDTDTIRTLEIRPYGSTQLESER